MGRSLELHAATYVSHTSDMGVELGLPDFTVSDVNSLLPPWLHRNPLEPELFEEPADQVFEAGGGRARL